MTKRVCPFEPNLMPQLKMHVGVQDVNCMKDDSQKAVHEKTMQLLFKGAKSHQLLNNSNILLDNHEKESHQTTSVKNRLTQMTLTNALKLIKGTSLKDVFNSNHGNCNLCSNKNVIIIFCRFCDKQLCPDCIKTCQICKENFCRICTLEQFSEPTEDIQTCISCYVEIETRNGYIK